jgi:hypothetical protein
MTEDEDQLRRGLRDLAQGDGRAGGLTAVETFLDKGRRARARRRGAAMACAVVLIAGGTGLGVRMADTSPSPEPPASMATHDPLLESDSAMPKSGVTYRYALPIRCDLRYIVLGGNVWVTDDADWARTVSWAVPFYNVHLTQKNHSIVQVEAVHGGRVMSYYPYLGPTDGVPPRPACLDANWGVPGEPKSPEIGVHYVHSLADCNLSYDTRTYVTTFGGRKWVADEGTSDIDPKQDSGRWPWATFEGEMILAAPDRARFELPGHAPITFRPYSGKITLCS